METETSRSDNGNREPATILVVEDDPALSSALCYSLRREGYRPVAAQDGEAALTHLKANRQQIDLVLLDLMLPRMPGLHVLRVMRQFSSAPVLILSALGQEQDKIDGLDLGADDYLVKPFALRELMARVRALLRTRSARSAHLPSVINRGPLEVDTSGRRVRVDGHEVQLRPKEFGLLLTLIVGANKVFTRQELLDAVWGEDVVVDERTVDVHVSWLRSKLRRAGLPYDAIKTTYGIGYRFSAGAESAVSIRESPRSQAG